jgi:hypothetical protein
MPRNDRGPGRFIHEGSSAQSGKDRLASEGPQYQPLIDLDNLLSKLLALQQSKKCLGHSLNATENIFLEADFPCLLPGGQALQCFTPPVPPVKNQKTMHAGPGDDHVRHKPFPDVRLAEPVGKGNTAANHNPCSNAQIFHDRVMDRSSRIVEEDVDAQRAGVLHRRRKVAFPSVIDCRIEADFAAP